MTAPTAPSERILLARAALDAALSDPAVIEGDPGHGNIRITAGPEGLLLPGVIAVAEPEGRYTISLGLRVRMTALLPLADAVRSRVERAARSAGLEDCLGPVEVIFGDVVAPHVNTAGDRR